MKGAGERNKPVAVIISFMATERSWAAAFDQQQSFEAGLPTYHAMVSALKAIGRLMRHHQGSNWKASRVAPSLPPLAAVRCLES